jgi:regulator of protease activity HflC (stomatin/prohibitin superfamily)
LKIPVSAGMTRALRPELLPGLLLLFLAAASGGIAQYRSGLTPYWTKLAFELAGPLFLAAGGFLSAYVAAFARARGHLPQQTFVRRAAKSLTPWLELARVSFDRGRGIVANIDWIGDWLPLGIVLLATSASLVAEYRGWRIAALAPSPSLDQWIFGSLIGLCFPFLVLERRFFGFTEQRVPEAGALSMLLRLVLANLLLLAVAFLFRWLDIGWWGALEKLVALLTALVAGELLLRNASYFFMPLPPQESRRGRVESLVAGLLRFQRPSLSAMSASVSKQFGIDLGRSWALGFIRRAMVPTLLGLAFAAWLMTGLTALDLSQRAVYEAFGRPQAVFHSGLHIHLPWPFGRLKPVEYGVVREIPIVFSAEPGAVLVQPEAESGETNGSPPPPPTPPTIEGPPPDNADRLWDASHPSEASYLVASNRNGRETFEVVNIDLQILYRVGLSDQAAYNATYSVDAPEDLIRAAAGRMLARYFARYTIPDVLGQNRERFIRGFQQELQARLNALASGVDVLGVVIEAIHPPAGAATAYQDVQAAGIRSETTVANSKGESTRIMLGARASATTMHDNAVATGIETVDQAKVDTALFAGDVTAYRKDGAAFLFERRLTALNNAIRPNTPITILDSRIPKTELPTLDLRPAGSIQTPPLPPPPPESADDEQ